MSCSILSSFYFFCYFVLAYVAVWVRCGCRQNKCYIKGVVVKLLYFALWTKVNIIHFHVRLCCGLSKKMFAANWPPFRPSFFSPLFTFSFHCHASSLPPLSLSPPPPISSPCLHFPLHYHHCCSPLLVSPLQRVISLIHVIIALLIGTADITVRQVRWEPC